MYFKGVIALHSSSVKKNDSEDKQIKPHQVAFSDDTADGDKSIVITTVASEDSASGNSPRQLAELRRHGNLCPGYGQEVWYNFAFKVTGDIQPAGSNRTVIGQLKAPKDNSPFLAQRFDNGVFHVTVQDGPIRMAVASAEGNLNRLMEYQDLIAEMSSNPSLGMPVVRVERVLADLKAYQRY